MTLMTLLDLLGLCYIGTMWGRYFARASYFFRFYTAMFQSVFTVFRSLNPLSLTNFMSVDVNTSYKYICCGDIQITFTLKRPGCLQDVECVLCVLAT